MSERLLGFSEHLVGHNTLSLFDLGHLSLFSTMTDEERDSVICDFIAQHGSTTGEIYLRGLLRAKGSTVHKGGGSERA